MRFIFLPSLSFPFFFLARKHLLVGKRSSSFNNINIWEGNFTTAERESKPGFLSAVAKMEINVAAIIQHRNKFLLVKQARGAHHEGLWAFPGGRVGINEALKCATKREVKEETNLNISVGELFHATALEQENVVVLFFKCRRCKGKIKPGDDVDEFAWVTLEEMQKYKMRPAMYVVLEKFKSSSPSFFEPKSPH